MMGGRRGGEGGEGGGGYAIIEAAEFLSDYSEIVLH